MYSCTDSWWIHSLQRGSSPEHRKSNAGINMSECSVPDIFRDTCGNRWSFFIVFFDILLPWFQMPPAKASFKQMPRSTPATAVTTAGQWRWDVHSPTWPFRRDMCKWLKIGIPVDPHIWLLYDILCYFEHFWAWMKVSDFGVNNFVPWPLYFKKHRILPVRSDKAGSCQKCGRGTWCPWLPHMSQDLITLITLLSYVSQVKLLNSAICPKSCALLQPRFHGFGVLQSNSVGVCRCPNQFFYGCCFLYLSNNWMMFRFRWYDGTFPYPLANKNMTRHSRLAWYLKIVSSRAISEQWSKLFFLFSPWKVMLILHKRTTTKYKFIYWV